MLAGMSLLRLFNQLLLATGGDPEEAMEWMRALQEQGHLDESIDLDAFFASLEEQQLLQRGADGSVALTGAGERRLRQSAFEQLFTSLKKGGAGYHPVHRRRRGGRTPARDPPLRVRRRHPPDRSDPLRAQRADSDPRRPRSSPRRTSRSTRPST